MSTLTIVLIALAASIPAVVIADLWSDVPRLARWLGRRAESIARRSDRTFFGWSAELEHASVDAANGRRSKISVIGLALGMLIASVRMRLRQRNVSRAFVHRSSVDTVKVHLPTLLDDGFQSESVWAEWVGEDSNGEDLYRIENHVVFSELARCGDIVRTTWHPLEDRPGYGWLKFAEVVQESPHEQLWLWHKWRLFGQWRYRRLHRDLLRLGMTSEWMHGAIGAGTLPEGPNGDRALRLLRRRRVRWEPAKRLVLDPHELPTLAMEDEPIG